MTRRVIGLDAGGTKLLAGVVDEGGEVHYRSVYPWPTAVTLDDVRMLFALALEEALNAAGEVEAIGVGIPANMDRANGVAISSRHLPIEGFAFRDWLTAEARVPVYVDNDATLALFAEATRGAARGARDVVLLTLGTGIGGGVMSGGQLVHGAHGAAGEPGHMSIDADGPPCPGDCPGRGCLEAYVSGPALARQGWPSGAAAVASARAGDAKAQAALAAMGEKLGVGLAGLMNLLDPDLILIGGGFGADTGDLLIDPAERVARERALEPAASRTRFAVAELGEDAGMLGAALLALTEGEA